MSEKIDGNFIDHACVRARSHTHTQTQTHTILDTHTSSTILADEQALLAKFPSNIV